MAIIGTPVANGLVTFRTTARDSPAIDDVRSHTIRTAMDHLHIDANSALLRLPERRWRTAVAAGPIAFDETFTDLDLARFDGVGHFPRREDPDCAVFAIATFFAWLAAAH